jgi:hypothetical protein
MSSYWIALSNCTGFVVKPAAQLPVLAFAQRGALSAATVKEKGVILKIFIAMKPRPWESDCWKFRGEPLNEAWWATPDALWEFCGTARDTYEVFLVIGLVQLTILFSLQTPLG